MSRQQPTVEIRKFPNGDTYSGGWSAGLPESEGTYIWSDGSSYSGGWKQGKKHGVGKNVWPSGSVYQGEWVEGYMQGVGTFDATDGTKYMGSWFRNQKHGLGQKIYANADTYEGLWQKGKAWGPGRYVWVDGNEYDGEWQNGVMHGQGTFLWKTGERYDGEWKSGQEDGQGVFTLADGSVFDGFWSNGRKHGIGLYRPTTLKSGVNDLDLQSANPSHHDGMPSGPSSPDLVKDGKIESYDGPLTAPSLTHRHGSLSHTERANLASTDTMYVREYDRGRLIRNVPIQGKEVIDMLASLIGQNADTKGRGKMFSGKNAKVGETIQHGHRSYELMLDLQLGIRWSVGKITQLIAPRELARDSFSDKLKVYFPRKGSKETPPHPTEDFKWVDYNPMVFRKLRAIFAVDAGEYMLSICGEQALRELSSPGKSGALFYISDDDRYLIKTMRPNEMKTFLNMLPQYYDHVSRNPHTLLTKFYGLYRITLPGQKTKKPYYSRVNVSSPAEWILKPIDAIQIRFIVMGNIFNADMPIHRRYDLKGSTQGRRSDQDPDTPGIIFKDLDLDIQLQLEPGWKARLERQLKADSNILRTLNVMDYSMLMGIHFKNREAPPPETVNVKDELAEAKKAYMRTIVSWKLPEHRAKDIVFLVHAQLRRRQKRTRNVLQVLGGKTKQDTSAELAFQLGEKRVQLGLGMSAVAVHNKTGKREDVVVYFGIIDFLQEYSSAKKAEHMLKSIRYDSHSISVVNPNVYATRFHDFMEKIFV